MPAPKGNKNGRQFNSETGRDGGQKSRKGKSLKTLLTEILNEDIPEKDLEKLKKKYGVDDITTNGEAIIREVVRKAKKIGDVKTLVEIMKLSGEYSEKFQMTADLNIVEVDKQDKGLV